MKRKKPLTRKLSYLFVSIILVLLLIGGSYFVYAAMTAKDCREADFQIGQVETKLDEDFDETITEIHPDQSRTKEVTVKNNGTIKQFIRVMVLPEAQADVADDPNSKQALPITVGTELIVEQLNTTDWKYGGDGYYYYIKEAVEPLKNTEPLFHSIKLDPNLSPNYHQSALTIPIKVEAVNCADNVYREAWWQGAVPTDPTLKAIDDNLKDLVEK
ncbi:TasA family protein [Enterococcus pallens]|uniref:Alternate signal-mediated exported protein n=1 Tax=Enterococcus pallens ATCC BAA-351 TaxID=1158607 RepID=R2SBR7_9ENTE|nr:TasA family protein [Enterococcus pallens]EOH90296.1 hypothetical protein UAU_04125 [Enterococcus pallens ATCC BAA-351]EOU15098.1 hypothetical protein I588_04030 [Enterococcus pallens ATCC BAA-351]OJG79170.1 hypothetical protein RV10_GL001003 [Enterococcus pallens]